MEERSEQEVGGLNIAATELGQVFDLSDGLEIVVDLRIGVLGDVAIDESCSLFVVVVVSVHSVLDEGLAALEVFAAVLVDDHGAGVCAMLSASALAVGLLLLSLFCLAGGKGQAALQALGVQDVDAGGLELAIKHDCFCVVMLASLAQLDVAADDGGIIVDESLLVQLGVVDIQTMAGEPAGVSLMGGIHGAGTEGEADFLQLSVDHAAVGCRVLGKKKSVNVIAVIHSIPPKEQSFGDVLIVATYG